jgi:RsmE family RNA methyltransferase
MIQGAEQAFCTRIPTLIHFDTLQECLDHLPSTPNCIALDNYEATLRLSQWQPVAGPSVLALGAERGWSESERNALRKHGFKLAHLGHRVLKTETAAIAGIVLTLARRGHI